MAYLHYASDDIPIYNDQNLELASLKKLFLEHHPDWKPEEYKIEFLRGRNNVLQNAEEVDDAINETMSINVYVKDLTQRTTSMRALNGNTAELRYSTRNQIQTIIETYRISEKLSAEAIITLIHDTTALKPSASCAIIDPAKGLDVFVTDRPTVCSTALVRRPDQKTLIKLKYTHTTGIFQLIECYKSECLFEKSPLVRFLIGTTTLDLSHHCGIYNFNNNIITAEESNTVTTDIVAGRNGWW
jgi:hypothetical protein